jgi:hypothetical protein
MLPSSVYKPAAASAAPLTLTSKNEGLWRAQKNG